MPVGGWGGEGGEQDQVGGMGERRGKPRSGAWGEPHQGSIIEHGGGRLPLAWQVGNHRHFLLHKQVDTACFTSRLHRDDPNEWKDGALVLLKVPRCTLEGVLGPKRAANSAPVCMLAIKATHLPLWRTFPSQLATYA